MKTLSIRDMRAALGRLDELLEREGELVISRRGKPVARLVPVHRRKGMPSHADFRSRQPRLSSSAELIREDRDGRG